MRFGWDALRSESPFRAYERYGFHGLMLTLWR
jgi:hypothetical protein